MIEGNTIFDLRGDDIYNNLIEISDCVIDFVMYVDDIINDVINNTIECMLVVEKMDSGASSSMSGDASRIVTNLPCDYSNVKIVGFNGSMSSPDRVGLNADGKKEYYVPAMPDNLALLSAHSYATDGAVILLNDGGAVLKLSPSELEDFKSSLSKFTKTKQLCVRNRTYEVCHDNPATSGISSDDDSNANVEAMSNTAVRFFNTKVNVSNQTERILTLLMTGLSFKDLYSHVRNGSLEGLPPDLTISALNNYEHRYGCTPDLVQLSTSRNPGHRQGLMTTRVELSHCGERYEVDCMEPDQSHAVIEDVEKPKFQSHRLASHGGAIAGAVGIDCYSGFVHGKLLKSTAKSVVFVQEFIARVELEGWTVSVLAADSGVLTSSMFQVMTPAVEAMCLAHSPAIKVARSEPYDHSVETGTVENAIGLIKRLMSLAVTLILRNPNLIVTGFTRIQVLKLWGEFFNWAIAVINLKPCPHEKSKSRYEVFMRKRPNMQNIRILPIGAIVMVYRRKGLKGASSMVGLYVGPSLSTEGCARVALIVGDKVKVITTSHFSAASDGGGLNVYPHVSRGLKQLLEDQVRKIAAQDDDNDFELEDPEKDSPPVPVPPMLSNDSIPEVVSHISVNKKDELSMMPDLTMPDISSTNILSEALPSMLNDNVQVNDLPSVLNENVQVDDVPLVLKNIIKPVRQSARQRERRLRRDMMGSIAANSVELETSCFADWTSHTDETIYWSFSDFQLLKISSESTSDDQVCSSVELGFVAITDNVPKSFAAALRDPLWGDAARLELNTLVSTGAIVEIDAELAKNAVKYQGADLVLLFPVYEKKVKEGKVVYKVRLVGDGRTHYHAGATYSATPSREELLILLHIAASLDWHYVHLDEKRAFLKAPYKGEKRAFTKLRGDDQFYEVVGALYGLKTAPRDYQDFVFQRLTALGFQRLMICSCIYVLVNGESLIILYDYVDDFIVFGNTKAILEGWILEFRKTFDTTDPIWNSTNFLGLEVSRDWERHIIKVTMKNKIEETCGRFEVNESSKRHDTPMPLSGYVVKDYEFDSMSSDNSRYLNAKEILLYLAVVGGLLWISGIRHDILFAVLYLTWSTKNPRQHHMNMALYTLSYLYYSSELPLVLGGSVTLDLNGYTDASLGTAPKGRSVIANINKLNPDSGAVTAKCSATSLV